MELYVSVRIGPVYGAKAKHEVTTLVVDEDGLGNELYAMTSEARRIVSEQWADLKAAERAAEDAASRD